MIDAEIADWLRSAMPSPAALEADRDRLLHRVDLNGVGPLLALGSEPESLPGDLVKDLRRRLVARELWEAQHTRVLAQALEALTAAGLTPILMKGTALAHSHYPTPAARVRGDSDILIEEEGRERALEALAGAGFSRALSTGGSMLSAEALFQKPDMAGKLHDIDLHWRLNSSPILAALFSHTELVARSAPVPSLGETVLQLGDVDALIYASVHRRLHTDGLKPMYLNGFPHAMLDSLSWLMDIHLLFSNLSPSDRHTLVNRAVEKDVAGILAKALRSSRDRLGTNVPEGSLSDLDRETRRDAATRYIEGSPVKRMLMSFFATRGSKEKMIFLRELLLPPMDYMRARYSEERLPRLLLLYLIRIQGGVFRALFRRGPST